MLASYLILKIPFGKIKYSKLYFASLIFLIFENLILKILNIFENNIVSVELAIVQLEYNHEPDFV
jgi:hypothetical protein